MILFLPMKVKAINIEPSQYDLIWYNNSGQQETLGTPLYTVMFNQGWYYTPFQNNEIGIIKVAFRYNLSNIQEDYVTFVLYGTINNGTAMLGGNLCESTQFNDSLGQTNYGTGTFVGITCRNPKANTWLDINLQRRMGSVGSINISSAVGTYNNSTTASINVQTQIEQQNWNNFNNADISQQDQTQPDTTQIDNVQQQETQQIDNIQTAIQNIQAPTFDLTDFRATFAWIWQTIIYLFTTHTILMSTMTIVLSLGFVKTIFGR